MHKLCYFLVLGWGIMTSVYKILAAALVSNLRARYVCLFLVYPLLLSSSTFKVRGVCDVQKYDLIFYGTEVVVIICERAKQ